MDTKRISAVIDLDAIRFNAKTAIDRIPKETNYLAVIKADAYGHGAVQIARALADLADCFAVATVDEGVEVRAGGIKNDILVLGYFAPEYYESAIMHDIQPNIFTYESALRLSDTAVRLGRTAACHIAVDTGMSRIGVEPDEASALTVKQIAALPNLKISGVFSHFATADETDKTEALRQRERFDRFNEMLDALGVHIPLRHINNSAGIMEFDRHYDMVRQGITLYGLAPSEEIRRDSYPLRPAMSLISHVSFVKTLPAGRGISYGRTYITGKETRVATVPVGYADGYPRSQSNKGRVIINGTYCPILGRVCMDQFMVDVSDAPDVKIGDRVTLVGTDGECAISVEEVAGSDPYSFNYEFVCGISRRVPRIYVSGGKVVDEYTYLNI
ncbi:MAG: alanine racemase [Clostridia bacterium]|nr:alanine racemase [Clostridia bacterium]